MIRSHACLCPWLVLISHLLLTTGCSVLGPSRGQCYILQDGGAYSSSSASAWQQSPQGNSTVARAFTPSTDSGVTTTRLGRPNDSAAQKAVEKSLEEEVRKTPVADIPKRGGDEGPQLETLRPSVPMPVVPAPLPGEEKTSEEKSGDEKKATLQVDVTADALRFVGSPIDYHLTVRNTSAHAADNVEILCEFDPGLNLPGKPERAAVQKLGEMEPGETREIDLTLTAAAPGNKACRFVVKGDNLAAIEPVSKSVEIRPRRLTLELSGPGRGQSGQKIYFDLTLHNPSSETLRDLDVQLKSGKEFTTVFAEGKPQTTPDGWRWKVAELKPGERVKYQVVLTCGKPMDNAQLSIEGIQAGLALDRVEANLEIAASANPAPAVVPSAAPVTPSLKSFAPPKLVPPDVELGEPQAP